MARMYPSEPFEWSDSSYAELGLFERFRNDLPDAFSVLHSVKWLSRSPGQNQDGEADFIVFHPEHGGLVLEVKGGRIERERDGNRWYSTDARGLRHEIKDPFLQAERSMRALTRKLQESPRTANVDYRLCRAVVLPDILVGGVDFGPNAPREVIIDSADLAKLEQSVMRAWNPSPSAIPGKNGVAAAVDLLSPVVAVAKEGLLGQFTAEDEQFYQLTEEQIRAFDMLRQMQRVAISGVAGSGKSLLAVEQARRLAIDGHRVLLTCFNTALADWASEWLSDRLDVAAQERLFVDNYHNLAQHLVRGAGKSLPTASELSQPDVANCYYAEDLPNLLLDSLDEVEERFDAIIVDEGQDFADLWWLTLEGLFADPSRGIMTIFYDDHQRIYADRGHDFPIPEPHFTLSWNCRNTQQIHYGAARYVHYWQSGDCRGPRGREIEVIPAEPEKAIAALKKIVHELVTVQQIPLDDIVVLSPRSSRSSRFADGTSLGNISLSWKKRGPNMLMIDSISAFKGLESPVVILVELDRIYQGEPDAMIHVGLTRAQHHAMVIGELPEPTGIQG